MGKAFYAEGPASAKALSMGTGGQLGQSIRGQERLVIRVLSHCEAGGAGPQKALACSFTLWRTETESDPAQCTQNMPAEIPRAPSSPQYSVAEGERAGPSSAELSFIK